MTRIPNLLARTAALALLAAPALAEDVSPARDAGSFGGTPNSAICSFTYFTNMADHLDFQGGPGRRCFDLKGGDDILILNRDAFPQGVRLSSGSGRDTVWATDADDIVIDPGAEDREIRSYGGDDVIEIEMPADRDPWRGVEAQPRTDLYPGPGSNTIRLGLSLGMNDLPRTSPDVWMTTGSGADDRVEAACGRHTVDAGYDLRSIEVPESARVAFDVSGCNVGVFGLYGDAEFDMAGGRLALQTYSESFRVPDGEGLPAITGSVAGSLGLMLDIDKADPSSSFTWEGPGSAFIRSRISEEGSGGAFRFRSGREIRYEGELARGTMRFDMAAEGVVSLDLEARSAGGSHDFTIAASRMDISWRMGARGDFPRISNAEPVEYVATSFTAPEIDWTGTLRQSEEAMALGAIEAPDLAVNEQVPAEAPRVARRTETRTIVPGSTRLRLLLRRENDRFAKCVSVRVIDVDGIRPTRIASCRGLSDPLDRIVIEDAAEYEIVRVEGDGVDLQIDLNGATDFRVDRLEVEA